MKWSYLIFGLLLAFPSTARADDYDRLKIGVQPDGRILVPTNQIIRPAGKQVLFPGRPVDLALVENGKTVVVKNMKDLVFIEASSGTIQQTLPLPKLPGSQEKVSFGVVGLVVDHDRIYVTDGQHRLWTASKSSEGKYSFAKPVPLQKPAKGAADLAGIALAGPDQMLVATSRLNAVQRLNLVTSKVEQVIPVGVSPYMIVMKGDDRAYVSNWGGDAPKPGEPQKESSGTPIRVDPRTGTANSGTVSVLERKGESWNQVKTIAVGIHPSGMILHSSLRWLFVANANSDTVSVIDTTTDRVVETINCRPELRLPFGSASNALVLSRDEKTLFVANGTNNCIAVVQLAPRYGAVKVLSEQDHSKVTGMIPTGWYPGAVIRSADGKQLYVANVKGHGSLNSTKPAEKGRNSHEHLGTISLIDIPDAKKLAELTAEVNANNRLNYSLAGLDQPRAKIEPVAMPARHGEPSVFKHVIYIIKENRTYDQVFGDIKEGNGEPKLCIFGEDVTPNHHKLAREFTLFDNFYCSGVLSADGHSWTDSAYVTDYLEKAFGSFSRSYPDDGRDPLAFAPTGFIWDNALAHGKTIRSYGEAVAEENYSPKGTKWRDYYTDYQNGTRKVPITIRSNHKALQPFTHPTYPYFPLLAPDVYRANLFIEEFKQFEKDGKLPNFIIMSLPCNHTQGTTPDFPTPRAMVADNDLALGRIVEAVSHSKFWKETCILVVEDDPQNGYDHVDGHRTVAMAISPYTKRKFVDHTNYNQTGMVKSIELMLGLPPMNQMDLAATPMANCFQKEAVLTPYKSVPNRIALDEMNPPLKSLTGQAKFWAEKSLTLNLQEGDKADEETLNRIIWHATKGYNVPYPVMKKAEEEDDD